MLQSSLRVIVVSVALLWMPCAAAAAPPSPYPDTPAGRRLAELIAVIDRGDEAGISAYIRDHFTDSMKRAGPTDPGIEPFLLDLARRFRGFDVVREISSTDDQVTMLVRPKTQPTRWLRYVLKVRAAAPHLVEGLFLIPAEPKDVPQQPGDELDPVAAVAAFAKEVERVAAGGKASAMILLARGGEVVLQRAVGEADRASHVPIQPATVFGLASMGKMFTAVTIARLVEQGKLGWNDLVATHLSGWLSDEAAKTVTLHQLLTHTSGLGDYLERIQSDPQIRGARSLSAYRDLVRSSGVSGKPEDGIRYSNTGYVVLGALIEAVTGRSYYDVVRDEVFAAAGMTRSGCFSVDEVVENRAIGYIDPEESKAIGLGDGWRTNVTLQGVRGTPAGGCLATAPDVLRFARALAEGKLVKPGTLDALLAPRERFPAGGDYAYGFVVSRGRDGRRIYGHAGGFPGVNGELKVYGDGEWTLVVLSNLSGGAGEIVGAWEGLVGRIGASR